MFIETLSTTQYKIVEQIIEAIDILGGKNDLTTPLCSWGDTLPEREVLEMLKLWNERSRISNQPQGPHRRYTYLDASDSRTCGILPPELTPLRVTKE